MSSGHEVNLVGRSVTELTSDNSEHVRNQVIDDMNSVGIINDPVAQREITRRMEDSGIIGNLALAEYDHLDVNVGGGRFRDGSVRRDDLEEITAHSRDYAPTTVLAAESVLRNFDAIRAKGHWYNDSDYISREMLTAYAEESRGLRDAVDPEAVFDDESDYNTAYNQGYDNNSAYQSSGHLIHDAYDRFKDWGQYAGRAAADYLDKTFPRAMNDADVGPGMVSMHGRAMPAKLAQSEFQRDNREYTIQTGDTLTSIARDLLERDGMECTPANVDAKMRYLVQRNKISNPNLIYYGKTMHY